MARLRHQGRLAEGFPAGRATRFTSRTTGRSSCKDGAGDVDRRLSVRRRRFPEGRQPAAAVRGDRNALTAPQTAVITQDEAIKRFGTDQVVGRTLTVISRGEKRDFKINGVLKDLPKNSQHEDQRDHARSTIRCLSTQPAAVPDLLGLPVGLGLCEAAARHRLPSDRSAACRRGKSATSPTSNGGITLQRRRRAGLALRQPQGRPPRARRRTAR